VGVEIVEVIVGYVEKQIRAQGSEYYLTSKSVLAVFNCRANTYTLHLAFGSSPYQQSPCLGLNYRDFFPLVAFQNHQALFDGNRGIV